MNVNKPYKKPISKREFAKRYMLKEIINSGLPINNAEYTNFI